MGQINHTAHKTREDAAEDAADKDQDLPNNEQFVSDVVDKLVLNEAFVNKLIVKKLLTDPLSGWQVSINNQDNTIRLYKLLSNGDADGENMLSIALNSEEVAQVNITQGGYQAALHAKGLNIGRCESSGIANVFGIFVDENEKTQIIFSRNSMPNSSQAATGALYRGVADSVYFK